MNNPAVGNLIREGKTFMLPGVIQTGKKQGMILMDDSLLQLVRGRSYFSRGSHVSRGR